MAKYISASGMIEVIEMLRWSNYLDKNSTLNLLVRAIEQAPTDTVDAIEVPRWIPVAERLPKVGAKVIACDTRDDFVDVLVYENGYWEYSDGEYKGYYEIDEITHWMPMPQPPKENV